MSNSIMAWSYGSNELIHHGIKGQHWGIRNFQNEDGSLTPAGKIRYGIGEGLKNHKAKREEKKAAKLASIPESMTWKAKEARHLSDAELNRRNQRLQKEQQYKNMTESRGSKRKKALKNTANTIFVASAVGLIRGYMRDNYKKLFSAIGKTSTVQTAGRVFVSGLNKIKIPFG